jgi:hypothetical protein
MPAPKNARTTDRGRSYIWPPTGEQFASVTTIQQAMAKQALIYWAAKSVAEGAIARLEEWTAIREDEGDEAAVRFLKGLPWDKRDRAADAGTAVHAAIEATVKGTIAPRWPKLLTGFKTQYERFLAAYRPEWVTSEATVYSRLGYAGTLDAIARIDGRTLLIDAKSGERIYDETSMQLAAYRYAEWIDLGDGAEHPLPTVDACAVLHLRPDRYQLVEVDAGPAQYQAFLHLLEVHRWMEAVKAHSPIGEQVMPVSLVVPDSIPSLDDLLSVPA